MKRSLNLLLPFLLLMATLNGFGQVASSCVQTLRHAQSTYENGRLHELPAMLKGCLENGFNTEERRQAYKLLVQSYIYLEEPEKADEAMLSLLSTDHFFKTNEDVDPAEFVALYNRFRTKPLFRFGVTMGPSINAPLVTADYSVGSASDGSAKYAPNVTFFGGLVCVKDFFEDTFTVDPERAVVAVEDFTRATWQIAQTSLRNVIGQSELDELLAHREKINEELQTIIDEQTEPWGVKVSIVEIKDVEIPEQMQRAMARQAEAERERRAKIINSEGEWQAAQKLTDAADIISTNPASLQLRYLQTLLEIGSNQNTTVVFPLPMDVLEPFVGKGAAGRAAGTERPPRPPAAPPPPPPVDEPDADDLPPSRS